MSLAVHPRRRRRRTAVAWAAWLPAGPFAREWLLTLARPRALLVRVAIPLILVVPLTVGGAPTFWSSMLLSVLIAMTGAVGTAVTLSRARASGHLGRLGAAPGSSGTTVLRWVLACACIDGLQLLPAVVVVAAVGRGSTLDDAVMVLMVAAALLVANALGCAVAALAGGTGEVLLDVGVLLAPLLYLGGLFTGVPRQGWRSVIAVVDPLAYLHSAFIAALGGSPWAGPGAIAAAAATAALVAVVVITGCGAALVGHR